MSESAGLKQLEDDEIEFNESNKYQLRDSEIKDDEPDSEESNNGNSNVSAFFRQSNQSLGLECSMSSPRKNPEASYRVPSVLQSTLGADNATFDVPKVPSDNELLRRDTISTIKSMTESLFETTSDDWGKVHAQLKDKVKVLIFK